VDLGKAAAVQGARFESRSTSPAERAFHEEEGKGMTQILVAFEDEYRVYRDAIARSLRLYRPHVASEGSSAWLTLVPHTRIP
jgi:hypothetical protein